MATLAELGRLGIGETMLLTGDTSSTARHIAVEAGICRTLGGLPAGRQGRRRRGFAGAAGDDVGDGVNDAPVLAAADVGIAMGAKGATAASESADVVIMLDDLSKTAVVVDIGQHTIRIARTSIWTGILLSIGLMLAATYGFVPAVAGALLQELVDLATILNALRALGGGRRPNWSWATVPRRAGLSAPGTGHGAARPGPLNR